MWLKEQLGQHIPQQSEKTEELIKTSSGLCSTDTDTDPDTDTDTKHEISYKIGTQTRQK